LVLQKVPFHWNFSISTLSFLESVYTYVYDTSALPRSKNPIGSNQPTKSDQILGWGLTFGSLLLESDRILVSESDGIYGWVLTDLYY